MRLAALLLLANVVLADADWKRGRAIYLRGAGTAIVNGSAELPASSLPCGSCHAPDGRGVAEGTVVPADVRWSALSRPRATGRLRARYDDALLRRALTHGIDASENPLSPVMPRYRMSDADLADLIAYLRRLGETSDPGLSASEIVVATDVAAHAPLLRAFFDDVNRTGGIYGRALRLGDANDDAFAMLSGAERDPDERMPVIAAFPSGTDASASFFLYPDLVTQALALPKALPGPRDVYVVHDGSEAARAAADALAREGWTVRTIDGATPGPGDIVFLLGRVDPGPVLARQWPARILVAAPAVPGDVTPEGLAELQAFAARHALPKTQAPAQIATYAMAKVLVEGLKRAGRDLTREKLISALEQLYRFPTGLTPPVTFHRNRRIGSDGYVVQLSSPAPP